MKMSDSTRHQLCAALVVAGIILWFPANIIPVMIMTVTGDVEPLTVLGGVQELNDSGLWPIAAIVFVASIVIPFCKLVSLSWLMLLHGTPHMQAERNFVLRLLRTTGSWSMIDLFLLSILTAVGQLGILASVQTQQGAFFFAAMVICSIFATDIYAPRLIWQTIGASEQ